MSHTHDPHHLGAFLSSVSPRVGELEALARSEPGSAQMVLQEAIDKLRSTVEELEVVREELLQQNEALSQNQETATHDAEWHRTLFDLSPLPCLATDGFGKITACNHAAAGLLGVHVRDLARKPLAVFVAEAHAGEFRRRLARLARDEDGAEWDVLLRPRNELPVLARARVAVAPDTARRERTLLWTLRDVTEERRRQTEREEADALLRTLLHAMPAGLALLDLDGTVLLWNGAAERLLGWTEDDVAGKTLPGLGEAVQGRLLATPADGAAALEAEVRHADGSPVRLEMRVSALPGMDGSTRGAVVFLSPAAAEPEDGEHAPAAGAAAAPEGAASRSWSRAEALSALPAFAAGVRDSQDHVRSWLAAGIHLGYLRPGDRLPSIREVAAACRVDHRAISLAYRTLAGEGVLEIRNRHGVYVAEKAGAEMEPLCESAGWLAEVLAEAALMRVRTAMLPELVRRWTASVAVRCACVESTEDDLAALSAELKQQWGLDTYPVALREDGEGAASRRADGPPLAVALRGADLVVTTPFHEAAVRTAAAAQGIPVVVLTLSPEVVAAAEERLREGPLAVVVADARHGERLRALRGGGREGAVRVVTAGDAEALAALDPAEPVLMTRAAQARLKGTRLRMLVPPSHFLSTAPAREVAEVLIRRNMEAERAG